MMPLFKPLYGQRFLSGGHRFQIGQAIGQWLFARTRGAFLEGVKHGTRFPKPRHKQGEAG